MKNKTELGVPWKWVYPKVEKAAEYEITLSGELLYRGASYHVARLLINIYPRLKEI